MVLETNGWKLPSNEGTLSPLDENIIALDPGQDIRIAEVEIISMFTPASAKAGKRRASF